MLFGLPVIDWSLLSSESASTKTDKIEVLPEHGEPHRIKPWFHYTKLHKIIYANKMKFFVLLLNVFDNV